MKTKYDVAIVGAGHNGLIAAAYLAKAGYDVAVFEKNGHVGGMSSTYEFIPGYKFSTGAMYMGAMPPQIREDMELYKRGFKEVHADPWLWAPDPDGKKYYQEYFPDHKRTADHLAKMYTKEDAVAYLKWADLWAGLTETFVPIMMNPPANLGETLTMFSSPEEQATIRRMLFYGLKELMDELGFVSPNGAAGYLAHMANDVTWCSPSGAMSAFACGMHYILPVPYMLPVGGMGAMVDIIAQVVRDRGGEVFVNSKVEKIVMKNGAATGLVVDGKEISAKVVLSTLSPKLTLIDLIGKEHLDQGTIDLVNSAKNFASSAQVHFALSELPNYIAAPGQDPKAWQHHAATVIAPSVEYCENCFSDWRRGVVSDKVTFVIISESIHDPSMAPPGKFSAKAYIPSIPYKLKEGSWDDPAVQEHLAEAVINTLSEYAPNFRKSIIAKHVFTPLAYERMFGNHNWGHIDVRVDQMFGYRPMPGWSQYKTPIDGLYFGGASCHGGPAVSGVVGHNSAKAIMENLGKK